jgi:hypothetical protein
MIRAQIDLTDSGQLQADDVVLQRTPLAQKSGIADPALATLISLMESEIRARYAPRAQR